MAVTREQVLDAALEIIDAEGVAGLSMRRLGRAVGIEAMSLYHYVADKNAVLDGVCDRVLEKIDFAGMDLDAPVRGLLVTFAHRFRSVLMAHPNVLPILAGRGTATAHRMSLTDTALGVFRRAGHTPRAAMIAFDLVQSYAIGATLTANTGRPPKPIDNHTPPPFDTERYANIAWLYADVAKLPMVEMLPDILFTDGLEVLLDGIDTMLGTGPARRGPTPGQRSGTFSA